MISDGQNSYSYNSRNQLEEFDDGSSVSTYGYAPTGLRRSKSVSFGGGTYENFSYTYDNGNLIFEYYSNHFYSPRTCIGTYYNYGPTGIISQSNLNTDENDGAVVDNSIIFEKDAHGDVIYKLNASDYSLLTYDSNYDAFGNGGNRSYSNLGYCGEYFDNESGLIYLRARYYNLKTGRFISEDPIRDGLNWYTYCANNPVKFVDPSGLIVTAWDKLNCTDEEINLLRQYTSEWETGNVMQKENAAKKAEIIRAKYRKPGEHAMGDGNTGFNGVQYSTYYYLGDTDITASQKKAVDLTVNFGAGLGANIKVAGVGAEIGAAMYYDVDTMFSNVPLQTMSLTGEVQVSNMLKVGGEASGTINAITKRHLYNDAHLGLKAGKDFIGFETTPQNGDFIIDIAVGGYFIVGGEVILSINLSKILDLIIYK